MCACVRACVRVCACVYVCVRVCVRKYFVGDFVCGCVIHLHAGTTNGLLRAGFMRKQVGMFSMKSGNPSTQYVCTHTDTHMQGVRGFVDDGSSFICLTKTCNAETTPSSKKLAVQ